MFLWGEIHIPECFFAKRFTFQSVSLKRDSYSRVFLWGEIHIPECFFEERSYSRVFLWGEIIHIPECFFENRFNFKVKIVTFHFISCLRVFPDRDICIADCYLMDTFFSAILLRGFKCAVFQSRFPTVKFLFKFLYHPQSFLCPPTTSPFQSSFTQFLLPRRRGYEKGIHCYTNFGGFRCIWLMTLLQSSM